MESKNTFKYKMGQGNIEGQGDVDNVPKYSTTNINNLEIGTLSTSPCPILSLFLKKSLAFYTVY